LNRFKSPFCYLWGGVCVVLKLCRSGDSKPHPEREVSGPRPVTYSLGRGVKRCVLTDVTSRQKTKHCVLKGVTLLVPPLTVDSVLAMQSEEAALDIPKTRLSLISLRRLKSSPEPNVNFAITKRANGSNVSADKGYKYTAVDEPKRHQQTALPHKIAGQTSPSIHPPIGNSNAPRDFLP